MASKMFTFLVVFVPADTPILGSEPARSKLSKMAKNLRGSLFSAPTVHTNASHRWHAAKHIHKSTFFCSQ